MKQVSSKVFRPTTIFVAVCRLVVISTLLFAAQVFAADIELRSGDWKVSGEEAIRDQHIRLDGKLILPAGTKLTLENCSLEIIGD